MKPYRTCPKCGCALDPGERCDCEEHPHQGKPYRPPDPHLAACLASGCYKQPFRRERTR